MKRMMILIAALLLVASAGAMGQPAAPAPTTTKPEEKKPAETAPAATAPKPDEKKPAEAAPAKTFRIGFAQSTFEDPWRINMNKELETAAAAHPELKLTIADGQNRNAKQIADVENFITMKVDLLIISPREAAPLTVAVAKAYDRGIPVIVLDRKVVGDKYTCFIGAKNLEIGRAAGEYVASLKAQGATVVELEGILGATPTQERHQGFHEAIKSVPAIQVVFDQPGDYKRSPAKQIMDNALQANKKIDVVYAHNDEMAIGAFLAAKAVGREKEMIFVGIDGQGEAVKMIRAGDLQATFVYPCGGKEAIDVALKLFKGETVPKEITLQTIRITKDENPDYQGF